MFIFLITFLIMICLAIIYYCFYQKEKSTESETESDEVTKPMIVRRKKSCEYVLHFQVRVNDSGSIKGKEVLASVRGIPILKIVNEYKPKIITNSTVWNGSNNNGGSGVFIVVCAELIDMKGVLLQCPVRNNVCDLHIIGTDRSLELYLNGKPQAFFSSCGIKMIPENIVNGDVVRSGNVSVVVSDDKPVSVDIDSNEFLPKTNELDFAIRQGAVLKANEIIKGLKRKYTK